LQILKNIFYKSVLFLVIVVFALSCSTKKNTVVTRTYHNITAYYNVFFNAKEAFKSGVKKIDEGYKDNYSLILPVFKFSDNEAIRAGYADMNRVIEKGSKCIRKHSIKAKPKRKEGKKRDKDYKKFYNQKEFVKWIDDSYLLIGKGHFYKHDFYPAIESFNYIIKEYSDKPIKYEGYLWLTRTYAVMKKYDRALEFLSKLESEKKKIPESLIGPIAVTRADILIRTKQFESAIPFMIEGVENTKSKKEKIRYQYILAQLYQETKELKKAYEAYGKVVDMNPNYEMTFNARINRASIFNATAQDSRQLQKELNKMLKDDKNIDYRDQIYYALGNIAYNETRDKDALDYFLLSANSSTENTNQKAISYLAAADLYFERPDYKNSQVYYDSSMVFLSKEYPNYMQIKNKSENLNDLVKNLDIIERQDSLQHVASLTESERNAVIDRIIESLIEKERLEKEQLAQEQRDLAYLQQQGRQMNNKESNQWYFYNPAMLSMGQSEFKKKWGERKNEDNWRRKNKTVMDWDSFDGEVSDSSTNENIYSNKTREYYLVDLPLSDSAMQVSKEKVEGAYYNMATIYKEKFNDFPLSAKGYLNLLKDFPETEYKLSTYYNLYKLYYLSKDYEKADKYKNLIITEYPDSEYAKVLSNPDYFIQLEKIENQVKFIYQATYKYFINDNCDEVYYNYKYADSAYSDSKLIPKFALLSTLCSGHSGDTVAFKDSLNSFKERYPGTEEATYVEEVLAALDRETREVILEEEEVFGGELATVDNIDSIDVSMYNFNPDVNHYYLVVVANQKSDANRIQFNLTNFNLDYYSFLEFDVSNSLLSADYTLITVKNFKNKNMANNYFESIGIAGEIFNEIDGDTYKEFIISKENFEVFKKDKNLLRYQKFFDDNYLSN